jgi:cellulose synthase/poly-beta-1,6-N-acetylglucosamine synthase-like glycosyltransferase
MNAPHDMSGISISAKTATQSHRPPASLIIVCYNQGNYLADALSTALGQTYDNVEIILVDDGSTDNTAEIAQGFPGVRYVWQKNSGLSAARNAGLQASHGKYVAFLDADDRLLPRALESGIGCFREFPDSGFVFGKYRHIDSGGTPLATQRDLGITGDYYWHLLHGNFIGMHATVMYSREALDSVCGFNTELRAAEDYDVYLRIARRWKVRQHGWLIAEYREHYSNMSGDRLVMLKSVLQVLRLESAHVPTVGTCAPYVRG